MARYLAILGVLLALPLSASAYNVDDGVTAFKSGKPEMALSIWKSLAIQGDAKAQYHVGVLYLSGKGVARDKVMARKWLDQSAKQGNSQAIYKIMEMRN